MNRISLLLGGQPVSADHRTLAKNDPRLQIFPMPDTVPLGTRYTDSYAPSQKGMMGADFAPFGALKSFFEHKFSEAKEEWRKGKDDWASRSPMMRWVQGFAIARAQREAMVTEKFAPIPALPEINLLGKADDFYKRIMANMSTPDNKVPNAVGNFLKSQEAKQKMEADKPISKPFGAGSGEKSYDPLSQRRQSYGGGALAALGATPAEMGRSRYSGGQSMDAVGNDIARAIKQAVDQQVRAILSKQSGNGAFAR